MKDSQVWYPCSNLSNRLDLIWRAGVAGGMLVACPPWMHGFYFLRDDIILYRISQTPQSSSWINMRRVSKACLSDPCCHQDSLMWLGFANSCCSYRSFILSHQTMPVCEPDQAADFQYYIKDCCLFASPFPSLQDLPCPSKVDSRCFLPLWAFSLCCCCCCCLKRPAQCLEF